MNVLYLDREDIWNEVYETSPNIIHNNEFLVWWNVSERHLRNAELMVQTINDIGNFKKVFLLTANLANDMSEILSKLPDNYYAFDTVLRPKHPRVKTYLFWSEWLREIEQDTLSYKKLTNPVENKPQYLFDCLLGKQRSHRDYVFKKVQSSNFCSQIFLSYLGHDRKWEQGSHIDHVETLANGIWPVVDTPTTLDTVDSSEGTIVYNSKQHQCLLSLVLPWKIYNQSWFSIITDTSMLPNGEVNEKVAKTFVGKRLFVYFGPPNTLAGLREIGFKTFLDVIDESYDLIEDTDLRQQAAWQQVEYLATQDPVEVYKKILPVLEHNQRFALQTNFKEKLQQDIKDIILEK